MFQIKSILLVIISTSLCFTVFCDDNETTNPTATVDYDGLMAICNKTFQSNLEDIKQLNYTGILPNESENNTTMVLKYHISLLTAIYIFN